MKPEVGEPCHGASHLWVGSMPPMSSHFGRVTVWLRLSGGGQNVYRYEYNTPNSKLSEALKNFFLYY